jgi:hypothetical protein
MSNITEVVISDVPEEVMDCFRTVAYFKSTGPQEVINWCLGAIAAAHPEGQFYWHPKRSRSYHHIDLARRQHSGHTLERVTVRLNDEALRGLQNTKGRFRCNEAEALGHAARLAAYFERKGGEFGFGELRQGRWMIASLHRIIWK